MSEADYRGFAFNVSLIKFHCAVFGQDALLDASFDEVLPARLNRTPDGPSLTEGDRADITFSAWPLPESGSEPPQNLARGSPLPGSNVNVQGVEASHGNADGSYPIGGLGKALVGMSEGEETLFLISPKLAKASAIAVPPARWLVVTVKVLKRSEVEAKIPSTPVPTPAVGVPSLPVDTNSVQEQQIRERSDSLKDRMAKLSLAGSGNVLGGSMVAALEREESIARRYSRTNSEPGDQVSLHHTNNTSRLPEQTPPGDNFAMVVHAEQAAPARPTRSEVNELRQQTQRRPSMASGRRMSTSPAMQYDDDYVDAQSNGYALQMLQMSSTSVERLVRDMEAKVDKLLRLQETQLSPGSMRTTKESKNIVDGEELISKVEQFVNDAGQTKAEAQKHQEKSSELQLKVSELLEKNQQHMASIIELRERHNDTLMKLSSMNEGNASSREELDTLRAQLTSFEETKAALHSQTAMIASLKTEKDSFQATMAAKESEWTDKVGSLEAFIADLKGQLEEAKQAIPPADQKDTRNSKEGSEGDIHEGEIKVLKEELEKAKSAYAESIEASKKAVEDVKSEASQRMKDVVKKKTQKVMGSVYKQMGVQFVKGSSYDGEEVMQALMTIMKETSNKMLGE